MDTAFHRVRRIEDGSVVIEDDVLAVEAPVEIRLGDVPVAVLMRTPGMERELALGFCLTEGILTHPREFEGVEPLDGGDRYRIHLAAGVVVDPEQFRRNMYTTSSCGVCGKASIDAVMVAAGPLPPGPTLTAGTISAMPARLRSSQPAFAATGAIHAAGIFTADGRLQTVAEDIGRHNAVDKAIGALAMDRWPPGDVALCVSGRISFEITQKAAVARIPVVVGVSAASSLAVDLATDLGMTVVGFTRGDSMVVYTDTERIRA